MNQADQQRTIEPGAAWPAASMDRDALLPVRLDNSTSQTVPSPIQSEPTYLQRLRWGTARLGFYIYIAFSLLTVVGGFLTAPLMSHLFFGDWRCWRHWRRGARMFPHGWRLLRLVLQGENQYMLSVPLTSPPQSKPDLRQVALSPSWPHGSSCGNCQQCCQVKELRCPILDTDSGFCTGYNSFYWRYFNCGRYPTRAAEIEYYDCPKWQMRG